MTAALASARRGWSGFVGVWRAHMLTWAQYRANVAIWATTGMLQVIVYLSVWRAVAEASGGSTSGFTASEFAGYFCAVIVVREATFSFVAWHLSGHIQQGTIAKLLARPQHPVMYLVSEMTSYRVASLLLIVPVSAMLFLAYDATVDTSAAAVLVAILLLPIASMVRLLGDVLIGLTSVKLIRISGVLAAYYTVVLFFSGQFAPIEVLPEWMQTVSRVLPFWWILGYPTELVVGRADVGDAWIAALVLGGWFTALLLALRWIWPRAMRHAETVGG
jgi:ABC-2 type transport system permease protein